MNGMPEVLDGDPAKRYPPCASSSVKGVTGPGLPIGINRGDEGKRRCDGREPRVAC